MGVSCQRIAAVSWQESAVEIRRAPGFQRILKSGIQGGRIPEHAAGSPIIEKGMLVALHTIVRYVLYHEAVMVCIFLLLQR